MVDTNQIILLPKRIQFDAIYSFIYSRRKGTPAAEMSGQIPTEIKKKRSATLIELQKSIRCAEFDKILGEKKTHTVLFESFESGYACGHTKDFLEVRVPSERPLHSEVLTVELEGHDGETFFGNIVDKA